MATTKSEIQLVVSAKDSATGTLKKVNTSMQGLLKVGKAVGAGMAVAGGAIAAFGVSSIKAFAESEKQMASVNATLATMGKKGMEAKEGILAASDAAVKLGFDDEDAALSITKLYQRTGDLTEAMRLNQVAMDLARLKNIELGEASKLVTLVLSGNARALKEYGIEIDETKGPLAALGELQAKVAGQSQSYANTTAGQLEVLAVQWGNVKEDMGKALVEGLRLNEWLKKISDYIASEQFKKNMATLGSAINASVNFAVAAVKTLSGILEKVFFSMFRLIDTGKEKWGQLRSEVSKSVDSMKKSWDSLRSALSKPISGIVNIAQKISGKLKGKALGGPVMSGQSYIVGEYRPEVFVPTQSGNIKQTSQVGGGSVTVNFNNPVVRDEYDLNRLVQVVKDTLARDQKMASFGIRTI